MVEYVASEKLAKAVVAAIYAPLQFPVSTAFYAIPNKERMMAVALSKVIPISLRAIAANYRAGSRVVLARHGELTEEAKEGIVRRIATWFVPNEVKEITDALHEDIVRMADDRYEEEGAWKLENDGTEVALVVINTSVLVTTRETVVDAFFASTATLQSVKDRVLKFFGQKQ